MTTPNTKLTPEELADLFSDYSLQNVNPWQIIAKAKDHISALKAENELREVQRNRDLETISRVAQDRDTLNSTIQRLEQDRLQSDRIIANEKKNSDRLFSECEELKKELLTLTTQMAGIAKACKQVDDVRIEEINQLRAQCSTMLAQAVTSNATVLEWIEPVIKYLSRCYSIVASDCMCPYCEEHRKQLSRLTTIKEQLEKAK